MIVIKTIKF